MNKVAIIGSRTFNDYQYMIDCLSDIEIEHIVSGGQRSFYYDRSIPKHYGADYFVEKYARDKQIPITIYYAKWNKEGKSAGFIRNKYIIKECDLVVAFWNGYSKGTKNSIDIAKTFNKETKIFSNGLFLNNKKTIIL